MKFIDENDHLWDVVHKGVYAYKLKRIVKKHGRTHIFKNKVPIDKTIEVQTLILKKDE